MSLSISSIETYNLYLASELIFSDLAATFLVQVGGIDPGLQLLDLFALGADFLNFFLSAVIDNPHLGQLTKRVGNRNPIHTGNDERVHRLPHKLAHDRRRAARDELAPATPCPPRAYWVLTEGSKVVCLKAILI